MVEALVGIMEDIMEDIMVEEDLVDIMEGAGNLLLLHGLTMFMYLYGLYDMC
ncbi:hypothetical protein BDV40DRAFT_296015 [Aspergillus tamarii]|uniref:Uncharacterized protein n=1 Tax=Aspergillus tamarii TaxID=41984 RepID=A0A5N6V7J2_ASPTM|nr:hypothetical protein BDV40DRAFT_296015 [Aspergillus tamarii]